MTGASLGYSGNYNDVSLDSIGIRADLWSSTIRNISMSYFLLMEDDKNDYIYPQNRSNKYIGRAVR